MIFFVYSCNGNFLKRINFEEKYFADVQVNLIDFFKKIIAPKVCEKLNIPVISCQVKMLNECEPKPMEVESNGGVYFCLICKSQIQEQENVKSFSQRSICCDMCDNWYHFKCVGMSKSVLNTTSSWFCKTCDSCNV